MSHGPFPPGDAYRAVGIGECARPKTPPTLSRLMLSITSRPHSGRYRLCRSRSVNEADQVGKRLYSSSQLPIGHEEGAQNTSRSRLLLLPNLMSCDTSRSSVLHPQQTRVNVKRNDLARYRGSSATSYSPKKERKKSKRSKRASSGRGSHPGPSLQLRMYQCDKLGLHPLSSQFFWGLDKRPSRHARKPTWTLPPMPLRGT